MEVPGWKAFRLAACAVWPCEERPISDGARCSAGNHECDNDGIFRIVFAVGGIARVSVASQSLGMGCSWCVPVKCTLDCPLWGQTV